MLIRTLMALGLLSLTFSAAAQAEIESVGAATAATRMEEVVVSGEQPGPGMWQVRHGDNTLWVLGTLSPVPKRMRWKSDQVETLIASAQQVIAPARVKASSDLGTFRTMLLLPAALRARNNPDEQRLVDVLPPTLYERWLPLRQKYLGRSRSIDKRRPIIAAGELYRKAIRRSGLVSESPVDAVVSKAARRHKVEVVEPTVEIKVADPKALLKQLSATRLDDTDCFERTLERLEIELGHMRARANAWAVGDIEALRELPSKDQARACIEAILGASVFQGQGFDDLAERAKASWLEAADAALAEHRISFATQPMGRLLAEDGYLAALAARGYEVVAPE